MMKNKKVLLLPLLFLFAVSPLLLSTASALTPREVDPYLRFEAYGWSDGYTVTIIGTMFATDPPLSWFDNAHAQLYDQDHVTIIYEADMPEYVTAYDFRSWRIDFTMLDVNNTNYYPALSNGAYMGIVAFQYNQSEWDYSASCLITVEKSPEQHIMPQYNGSLFTTSMWLDVPQPYNTSNLVLQNGDDLSGLVDLSGTFAFAQSEDYVNPAYSCLIYHIAEAPGAEAFRFMWGISVNQHVDWSRYTHIAYWIKTNISDSTRLDWRFLDHMTWWGQPIIFPAGLNEEWTFVIQSLDLYGPNPRSSVDEMWIYCAAGTDDWYYILFDDVYLINYYGFTEASILVKDTAYNSVWYNETITVPGEEFELVNWTGNVCPIDKLFNFNVTDLVLPNGTYYIQSYIDWCSDTYYASQPFYVGDTAYYGPAPEPGSAPPDLYMLGYQYLFWLFLGNGLVTYPFMFLALAGGLLVVTALKSNRKKYDRVILGFAMVVIGLAMLFYASVLWGLNLASPLPLPYSILLNNWGTTGVLP